MPEHSRRGRAVRRFLGAGEAGQAHGAGGSKIASSISLQMISRVLGIVAGLVTLPLLARTLGPDGYGVWTAALGFVGLFAAFTEFGLANAATQRMAADPENEAQWLAAASSLRTLIGGALTILCIVLIPIVFGTSGDAPWVALILVTTILSSGAVALMAVFKSRLQMGIPLLLSIVQNVLWMAAVAVIALTDSSVEAVAIAYAAILGFVAILQVIAVRTNIQFQFSGAREWWPGLLQIALPVGLGGVFVTIYYQLDAVLLFHIAGADETGVYGVAYRFFNSVVLIPGVVMGAFMPVIAAHYGKDNSRVKELVQRAFDLMAVISLPGLAVALVLSTQIIAVFAGPGFDGAQTVLPILMAAFIPICLGNIAGFVAPVVGLRWKITAYAAVGAVANIGLNLILIPSHGAIGAAWATLITEVVTMSLLFVTCLERLHFMPSLLRWVGAIAAAALMGGAMLLVRPLGLVPALIAGGVVYAAALWILRVVTPEEIASLRPGKAAAEATTTSVSIVIPSYNRADALRQTLPSVFAVRGVDEIVLVDDASTDDTQEFLATLDEPRLRVILQPENQGVQAARNTGMAAAHGEWVIFGEDDVWFPADYAEVMLRVAAEQDADIVGSPWLLIEDGDIDGAVARAREDAVEHVGFDQVSTFPARTFETPFVPARVLLRRSISEEIQYDEGYRGNAYREETDFFVTAARAGYKVVLTPETFHYQERTWGGGVHGGRFAYEMWAIRNTNRFLRKHGRWLRKNGYSGRPAVEAARFAKSRVGYHLAPRWRRIFKRGDGS